MRGLVYTLTDTHPPSLQAHTNTYTWVPRHIHTLYTHKHTRMYPQTGTHRHTVIQTYICKYKHTCIQWHVGRYRHIHVYTDAETTHSCGQARGYTHTLIATQEHSYFFHFVQVLPLPPWRLPGHFQRVTQEGAPRRGACRAQAAPDQCLCLLGPAESTAFAFELPLTG